MEAIMIIVASVALAMTLAVIEHFTTVKQVNSAVKTTKNFAGNSIIETGEDKFLKKGLEHYSYLDE